ncbi:MAG: dihydropteroate synthase [Gammaproteobacteria bacterium]|jgi:dihydropteroate synthase
MDRALDCAGKTLDLSMPQIMGVLNVTPDSFSDGGLFIDPEKALSQAHKLFHEGAAIVDVGGESTRPGAASVSAEQEMDRVIPVIEAIHKELPVIISIDTSKPQVMREAVQAGAGLINDVYALRQPEAVQTVADLNVPVCLMHMQGEPRTMQHNPHYADVVNEVKAFLQQRVVECVNAGIDKNRLIIDPGFGFGKSVQHNLRLVKHLSEFFSLDLPVLVGFSRKSTIGAILEKPTDDRVIGSISLATIACWLGANIFRVHDVKQTADALKLCTAVKNS